jgi:Short C-terminal domain
MNVFRGLLTTHPHSWKLSSTTVASQLQELAKLKEQGILTEEEFQAKKKQILDL